MPGWIKKKQAKITSHSGMLLADESFLGLGLDQATGQEVP